MSDSRGTNSSANNKPSNGGKQQWQQQPQPLPQYTLPGVINYLTSEFTNLERFKIMTNLEKSEMKHKIIQLQGEVNSLKYINNKQATRIQKLEEENLTLKNQSNSSKNDVEIAQDDDLKNLDEYKIDTSIPLELPEIDLTIIKKSRHQLTKSMKEIVHLLKTPSVKTINCLNLPDPDDLNTSNDFDILINNTEDFEDKFEFNGFQSRDINSQSLKLKSDFFVEPIKEVSHLHKKPPLDIKQETFKPVSDKLTLNDDSDVDTPKPEAISEFNSIPIHSQSEPESDAETVILDDKSEPDFENSTPENQPETMANIEKITSSLSKPPKFTKLPKPPKGTVKQFTFGEYEIHLKEENSIASLKISSSKTNFTTSFTCKLFSLENIVNIFPLTVSSEEAKLLILERNGGIISLISDTSGTIENEIERVENILVSHLTTFPNTNNINRFGLVVEGSNKHWFLKVYDVRCDQDTIKLDGIGAYRRSNFASGTGPVKFVNWQNNTSDSISHELVYEVDGKNICIDTELLKTTEIV